MPYYSGPRGRRLWYYDGGVYSGFESKVGLGYYVDVDKEEITAKHWGYKNPYEEYEEDKENFVFTEEWELRRQAWDYAHLGTSLGPPNYPAIDYDGLLHPEDAVGGDEEAFCNIMDTY